MNKLKQINEYVRLTLNKLPGIRGDLLRIYEDWQGWTFTRLVDVLRKWTTRNPKIIPNHEKSIANERFARFKRESSKL